MRMGNGFLASLAIVGVLVVGGCASLEDNAPQEIIGLTVCLPPMDFAITAVDEGYIILSRNDAARFVAGKYPADYIWIARAAPGQNLNEEWITIEQFGYSPDEFGNMCPRVFLRYAQQQTTLDY